MKESYQKLASAIVASVNRFAVCLATGLMIFMLASCSSESGKTEVSASSSGFKPADSSNLPQDARNPGNSATAAQPIAPGTTPPIPTVPTLPSFDPTQIDPALAAKSYMKLEMTSSQDPKELARFLVAVDRSLQEMQKDAIARLLNNDQIFERGMAVARIKLTTSERLEKVATSSEEKSFALMAKLEALAQMAQFKDVASADELRVVAKQLATNEDPKVAMQALRMQLMSAMTDLENQTATPESVFELAKAVLEKMVNPEPGVFSTLAQTAQVLDSIASQSDNENATAAANTCDQLVDLIESKFREAENPQLGMMAWRMKMQRLPDFESYLKVLDTRAAASANPGEVGAIARELMKKMPSPFTAIALTQCATQFEYMGNTELAKTLFQIASEQLESTKSADLKKEIQASIEGFRAKSDSIGKPLPLDALVDTEGQPLDPARYAGKVVLVDFWATWCGPCVAEIPNIEKVYEKQHDAGFEVIAINLDDRRSDLDAFMTQKKVPWSVYVSSVAGKTGLQTPLARSLLVNAIPFTMLIGRDGNVAAIHIRGTALDAKVEQLLNATPKSE